MKIGLIGVNSQFVHSNLALYYLRENLPGHMEGEIKEFNNNEPVLRIFYEIVAAGYDVIAFSVYLWNKETVIKLLGLLKESMPKTVLVLGGPEPTFAPDDFSAYGIVVFGALEPVWPHILTAIERGDDLCRVREIAGEVQFSENWKFPYREEDLPHLKNRLVYYETSRGCPYRCSFCLSSAERRTAYLPVERVKKELDFFLNHEIAVVKLVDRTFNAPRERAKEILQYLLDHYKEGVTFHFELKGELLDEETLALLVSAPKGFFQVEIGVQSLNERTLNESCRLAQWEKTRSFYKTLIEAGNVHTHFDLIAALPYEDFSSFAFGFNEVMSVYPDYLQLGFLKLLPGTKLEKERESFGYIAESFPPYEAVKSNDISTMELYQLKRLDQFMDTVYNKGILRQTLRFALKENDGDSFSLFCTLAKCDDYGTVLQGILPQQENVWTSLIRLDSFLNGSGGEVTVDEESSLNRFLQDKNKVSKVLPHYANTPPREIYKRVRLLLLPIAIVFDSKNYVEGVTVGETRLLLDYRAKGRQKKGKARPQMYLLDKI
jgi:radical SAM superfamily enzyme YgiQ (UPF0313 family)